MVVEDISGDIWVAGGRNLEVPCSSHDERSASIMDESGEDILRISVDSLRDWHRIKLIILLKQYYKNIYRAD